jgi:hypothetical protein
LLNGFSRGLLLRRLDRLSLRANRFWNGRQLPRCYRRPGWSRGSHSPHCPPLSPIKPGRHRLGNRRQQAGDPDRPNDQATGLATALDHGPEDVHAEFLFVAKLERSQLFDDRTTR